MSQFTDYWSLAAVVFLTAILADAFRPANGASVTLLTDPQQHRRAFALNRLDINLGYSIGPMLGGLLATVSYQFLFWIDGLTSLLAAGTFIGLLGLTAPDASRPSATSAGDTEGSELTPLASPARNPRNLCFLLLCFLSFSVFFQLISTFPLFLSDEYQLSKRQIGGLFAIDTLVVVACEMLLIHWLAERRITRLIAWGAMLMCSGFGLLPSGSGFAYAVLTLKVWTVGEMLAMPQMLTFVAQASDQRSRSVYMGFFTTCVAMAMNLGPLVGGYLYQLDHSASWHTATGISLVVLVGFYGLDWSIRPRSKAEEIQPYRSAARPTQLHLEASA
jgi:predicted MFS family arabinose efflux permease